MSLDRPVGSWFTEFLKLVRPFAVLFAFELSALPFILAVIN